MSFVDQALSLINKTEANLRRIDAFGEDFAIPSLNEWRYAIRHVVTDCKHVVAIVSLRRCLAHPNNPNAVLRQGGESSDGIERYRR